MKKTKKRRIVRVVVLVLIAGLCSIGWNYLQPMLSVSAETIYESYTVETGSIVNTMCFSASLALSSFETLTSSASTTVRNVFVEGMQRVSSGDRLIQLANGEIFRAGIDGVVNEVSVSPGDAVYPGTTLAEVCDLANMNVIIQVDEYDIDKISVGQSCTVTIMSLGRSFDTQISHINRISSSSGAVAYYTVTAKVTVAEDILPGMQASVSIPSAEAENVPVLDMNALGFDDEKKPYVLIRNEDGGYDRTFVEVGLNDGLNVEIKEGLAVGDVVYAVSGTESVEPMFSFVNLYKAIVGETVVINDMSRRGGFASGGMPFERGEIDWENPPEGFDFGGMNPRMGADAPGGTGGRDTADTESAADQTDDGNLPDRSDLPMGAAGDNPPAGFDAEGARNSRPGAPGTGMSRRPNRAEGATEDESGAIENNLEDGGMINE